MDDYVVDVIIVGRDNARSMDDTDVNIAVDTILGSGDVQEEVLHVNAEEVLSASPASFGHPNTLVVPARSIHLNSEYSETRVSNFGDTIQDLKNERMPVAQRTCKSFIGYRDHTPEFLLDDVGGEIVPPQVSDEQGYENSSTYKEPHSLHSSFTVEYNNESNQIQDPGNSITGCALCRTTVHQAAILNGKNIQAGQSDRDLSQVLESSVDMDMKIMCETWPICGHCITLLQQVDALQHQLAEMKQQLMTMLKPQLVHKKPEQSPNPDITKVGTTDVVKLPRKKKRKLKIVRPMDPTIPNQHMKYKREADIDDDPILSKESLPPSFLISRLGEGKRMTCPICVKEMTRKYFVAHVRTCHAKTESIICMKCVKKYPTEGKFAFHMVAMHSNTPIEECAFNTDIENKTSRKGKTPIVRPKIKVDCPICKVELNKRYIKRHMQEVHSNDKHYKCKNCNESFVKQSHRRIHMSRVHGVNYAQQKEYRCPKCARIFIGLGRLQRHIEGVHEHRRNYQCNQCEAAFKTNYGLVLHNRRHTDERPFVCLICNKAFRRSGSIKKHLRRVHNILSNVRLNDPLLSNELPVKKICATDSLDDTQQIIHEQPIS